MLVAGVEMIIEITALKPPERAGIKLALQHHDGAGKAFPEQERDRKIQGSVTKQESLQTYSFFI